MGFGGTAKKLQKVTNAAEELYGKMNEVISQLKDLQQQVEETDEQVDRIEVDVAEQRALLEALAAEQGIDVDDVLADADVPDAESGAEPTADEQSADDSETTPETTSDAESA